MKNRCMKCGSSDLHFDSHAGHAFCNNCNAAYMKDSIDIRTVEATPEKLQNPVYVKLTEHKL